MAEVIKRIQTFVCQYQTSMPYHLTIIHRPILDGRNREPLNFEIGHEEQLNYARTRENNSYKIKLIIGLYIYILHAMI